MPQSLFSRPDFDEGTAYLFQWCERLISKAREKGYNVVDVKGKDVTAKSVLGRLRALRPRLVCLNGHGDKTMYCGHEFEPVITLQTADSLNGTTTFVRACNCLDGLGEKAIEGGCSAFVGYSIEFIIPIQNEFAATPLKDPIAKPVLEASNEVMESLLDGKTPKEAVEASHRLAREHVRQIMYSKEFAEDMRYHSALFALVNNDMGLGCNQAPT